MVPPDFVTFFTVMAEVGATLFALVPQATIGNVTVIMSSIGLINTVFMGISLFQDARNWAKKLAGALFVVSSLVIFGLELYFAIHLEVSPADRAALSDLTTLLVIIYLFGVARAWDLVGARQFHLHQLFAPLTPKRVEEFFSG